LFAYDYQTTKGYTFDSFKIRGFRFNIISTKGCLNDVVVVDVVVFIVVVVVVVAVVVAVAVDVVVAVVVAVVVFVVVSPTGHFILSSFFNSIGKFFPTFLFLKPF
jgi:hypothetical protein